MWLTSSPAADAIEKVQHVMTQKSGSNGVTPNSAAPKSKTERMASSETTREIYLKELSANPKWRDTTKSGSGFVIGGGKASTPESRD